MEDIILKIQKLLALSKSSNDNEAQTAMMMAQRLLIKYKLSIKDIEQYKKDSIKVDENRTGIKFRGSNWKSNISQIIADNFGCYLFYRSGRTHEICFYGKEEDVVICNIMLEYAIKCINSNGDKLIKKLKQDRRRKYFKGIKNDYALGFVRGLDERFKEQLKSNKEWALVLVKDQVVIDKYEEFSNDFETIQTSINYDKHLFAFKLGKKDGKNFDISNKIENEMEENKLLG
ncbi:UNVERIFIED_ORG: hypothetical protein B2H98_08060 [Clostridium botulinum]|uniref:DUF2786 domain-containing protein n=1 Tax=Clostridium botulinum TaxID=1491 RepID=A0A6B4JNZ1_CLOBO|nr:DUF2786 domain-containing protein [Clostridium botulinum]EES50919.1 conserved hypothetical protein [Clostridium botulinum E1 str. 'BoNT E Beluga']MBY6761895.1 DUF2786 domain-containing protein [Clostridium botulinum]MBY6920821.1 DUF2786 domain-containing protein [Clostridium botulinum]MBY7043767.1 DUF2786 domain-containing protein [Clostridium botulinum]MCR1131430.1 DUF2786 domain-containing protein [Clostridium botulinum]